MAKEWAGGLVHAWAARLVYGILLSVTILIIAWMLASTLSFGLRLVWPGVILFFFWKLVQKVQEMIRPGRPPSARTWPAWNAEPSAPPAPGPVEEVAPPSGRAPVR